MFLQRCWWALKATRRLRGYKPKPITFSSLLRWANQFPRKYRTALVRLVANIEFVSEEKTVSWLVTLNQKVLDALQADGLSVESVIYVTTDITGSSSSVMLDLLRTRANLEKKGVKFFLHSGEGEAIQEATMELERGAIIYVDDFAGTGKQFARSRSRVAEYITGAFSEFLLVPCICEEAYDKCAEIGVQAESGFVHWRVQRPLRRESDFLSREQRSQLLSLFRVKFGPGRHIMGFKGLATHVVFYRNAPNTTPLVFRGNLGQQPVHGILPRFDDL